MCRKINILSFFQQTQWCLLGNVQEISCPQLSVYLCVYTKTWRIFKALNPTSDKTVNCSPRSWRWQRSARHQNESLFAFMLDRCFVFSEAIRVSRFHPQQNAKNAQKQLQRRASASSCHSEMFQLNTPTRLLSIWKQFSVFVAYWSWIQNNPD